MHVANQVVLDDEAEVHEPYRDARDRVRRRGAAHGPRDVVGHRAAQRVGPVPHRRAGRGERRRARRRPAPRAPERGPVRRPVGGAVRRVRHGALALHPRGRRGGGRGVAAAHGVVGVRRGRRVARGPAAVRRGVPRRRRAAARGSRPGVRRAGSARRAAGGAGHGTPADGRADPADARRPAEDPLDLRPALSAAGLGGLLDPVEPPDLGGISDQDLYVSQAWQQALLQVDAEGTVAAAVTEIVEVETAAEIAAESITFRVDRPYVFSVSSDDTGWPLFTAAIRDPRH